MNRKKIASTALAALVVLLLVLTLTRFSGPGDASPVQATEPPQAAEALSSGPPEAPSASPAGEAEPDTEATDNVVEKIIEGMSLRQKICQMFIVYPGVASLEDYPVGGLVYLASHLSAGPDATLLGIERWQRQSDIPLLVCADEEGGSVSRIMSSFGLPRIGDMYGYRSGGEQAAQDNASAIAEYMISFGFNTNFAPVADVWSNPDNTVIGRRAYSDDFDEAAELVASAVEGFKSQGLICTLKHFPGHGDTAEDSHYSSAIVTKTPKELYEQEFKPFISGINAGADMVMIGHLTVPSVSDEPATVSYEIVTDILRGELGFDGVIISDGLQMAAVTSYYSSGPLCVAAVKAGIDILLAPVSLTAGVSALEDAVKSGEISEERIDQSVSRILELKHKYGLL